MRGTVAGSLTGTTLAATPAEPSEIRALTPRSSSAPTAAPTAEFSDCWSWYGLRAVGLADSLCEAGIE